MSSSNKFSSPSPVDGYYDVFLSFRGTDTRNGFTTNLYHSLLDKGIHTFMDTNLTGEDIEHLFQMIEKSRMGVVIYSKEYASSDWCLRELEKIIQLKEDKKMRMIPIFYKVNLDELKHLKGQTAEYLDKHIAEHGEGNVEKWKDAVRKFGKVSGLPYKDTHGRSEHDFIEQVVIAKINQILGEISEVTKNGPVNSQVTASTSSGHAEGLVAEDGQFKFTYGEILKITNNLDKLIEQGGLGAVYSGRLNGVGVAVKILPYLLVQKVVRSPDVFDRAVIIQLSFRHENLVSLVGYCRDNENVAFIYEFMENGNLRKHLSGGSPIVLTWKERLRIAVDVAEGLKYLHSVPITTHGNLQTTDILLDVNMKAKILFFQWQRSDSESISTYAIYMYNLTMEGAFYLTNPLLVNGFKKKLDLHSFAMILFELVTGHAPIVTSWYVFLINLCQGNLIVDMRLGGQLNSGSAVTVIQIAISCVRLMPNIEFPQIGYVLEVLKLLSIGN